MGRYRKFYLEIKQDFWDPLSPELRNRVVGSLYAFESGTYLAILTALTSPVVSVKQIFVTSLIAGGLAARNYLKQPARVPFDRPQVTDKSEGAHA